MRYLGSVCAIMVLPLVLFSCTGDDFEIGPNGNPYLRSLSFRDGVLIPAFDPKVHEYSLLIPESMPVWAKFQGYVFTTRPFLNGKFCRVNTNEYGFPDYTDITRFITNELLIIDSIAADGMKKSYRIQLLGSMHDARLSAHNSIGGEMYPPVFTERKPPFFLGTDGGVDTWTVSTKEDLVILTASKMDTEASLTVNGHPIAVGELEGEYRVTNMIARGSVTNWLTNISWQGDFTNVKQIIVNYIDPATDNRILSIDVADSVSGYTLPPLPRFHYTTDNYTVVLDNTGLCRIMVRLAQTNATVTLRQETTSTQQQAQSLVADSRSGDSVIYENLRLQQGDLLTFTSTMGSATREYRYRVRAFTTTPYGINGNISRVLQDIQTRKEIFSKSGYAVDVEGIVTFMTDYDENVKAGMFIEDGAWGLYVWSWNGWKSGLKPGMRIRTTVTAGKMYYGMPEATDCSNTRILNHHASQPVFYQDGTRGDWSTLRHCSRIFRYRTTAAHPLSTGYSQIGEGAFSPAKFFKIFVPNNKNFESIRTEAKDWLVRGTIGDFWGPMMTDGEGFYLLMKGKEYISIPLPGTP